MANKKFSDTSLQTLTDALKILSEGAVADSFGHITGQKILDYIIAKGYLTKTEIEALATLVKFSDFTVDNSVIRRSGAGFVCTPVNQLKTAHPLHTDDGFVFTATTNLVIGAGMIAEGTVEIPAFTKTFTVFAEGTGNGCLDGASLVANKMYEIHLIYKTADPTDFDYYVTTPGTGAPTNWTYVRSIGTFITSSSSLVHAESIVQLREFQLYGKYGVPFPKDYLSAELSYSGTTALYVSQVFAGIGNMINLKWFNSGSVTFAGMSANTKYFVYLQVYNNVYSIVIDTSEDGSGLTCNYFVLIGSFKTDGSGNILNSSILSKPSVKEETVILNYYANLSGIASGIFLEGYSVSIASSLTATYSTDFTCNGMPLGILVNSISDSGSIIITGTSINDHDGTFTIGDTETVPIGTTAGQRYRSIKKWVEVTNVAVSGITTINYNLYVQGVQQMQGEMFDIIGYSMDIVSSAVGADLRLKILKCNFQSTNGREFQEVIEDIGIVSGSATNQIVDNVVGGTRTLNPAIAQILDSGETYHLEQRNFRDLPDTSWGPVYSIDGSDGSGFQVVLTGQVAAVPTNINYVKLSLFIRMKSELLY